MSTRRVVASACAVLALPSIASAHLVTTGLGPVYDGITHFALTIENVVPALALALFAGMRGAEHGRRALFVVVASWLLGGALGLASGVAANNALTAIAFLLLGGLLAADARTSLVATGALAAPLGLVHGYLDGAAFARPELGVRALLGTLAAVFVVVALAASVSVPLRAPWSRIAVRVLGGWTVAIGLLQLGWTLRART